MTKKYRQLSQEQRYQLESLLKVESKQSKIADILNVHRGTISRELKRNASKGGIGYQAEVAVGRTTNRHRNKAKHIRFTEQMKAYIRKSLKQEKYSPELISVKGRELFGDFVSTERIYQWIWHCKKSQSKIDQPDKYLFENLKHGRRRQKRAKLTDRKSRMSWLEKIYNKEASHIQGALEKIILRFQHQPKSITFDNDKSFANHYQISEKFNIKTYFTHPYSSQEKGTVENRIGVIRRFFDKKTDFTLVTETQVKKLEQLINDRPMRMFNYKSSKEIYYELLQC